MNKTGYADFLEAARKANESKEMFLKSFYQELGRNFRTRREELGLIQEDIGKLVGLSRTSVTNIESGRQRILAHDIYLFAQALNVSPKDLMPD